MALPRPAPEGGFTFTHHPTVEGFHIPAKSFISARQAISGAATGALVFSRATGEDRVLLIQRAPCDSMPLRWEIPGGACDLEDESLLHGLARELWEEAGLTLRSVTRQVGQEHVFRTTKGFVVAKVTFEVEVEAPGRTTSGADVEKLALPEVTLDPNEHVRHVWATEAECATGKAAVLGSNSGEEVDLRFTTEDQRAVVVQGFQLRRGDEGTTASAA